MLSVIWHLGAWADNFGDRVLQVANTSILREKCKKDLQFVYVNCQKTLFNDALINKMNKESKLLYIGGGGLIFFRKQDNSVSGWQFNIRTEDIDKIKIPIVVYGIGFNKFPYDRFSFPDHTWKNIQKLIDKSALFSVRNNGTLEQIGRYCSNTQKVTVVPDAGMFIKPDPFPHKIFDTKKLKIGINFATDRPGQRFNTDVSMILRIVAEGCKRLVNEFGAQIYLIEHLIENDLNRETKRMMHDIFKRELGENVCVLYDELQQDLYPPFEYKAGFFADIYRQMDIVFGMRGHANIIPFGQNTPFIGIGEHNKVKWFLDDVMRSRFYVSLGDGELSEEKMVELVREILSNKELHKMQMTNTLSTFSYIKDSFMERAAKII
jgi:polysaccharide pyruvyl transferase WcaK-like protein